MATGTDGVNSGAVYMPYDPRYQDPAFRHQQAARLMSEKELSGPERYAINLHCKTELQSLLGDAQDKTATVIAKKCLKVSQFTAQFMGSALKITAHVAVPVVAAIWAVNRVFAQLNRS